MTIAESGADRTRRWRLHKAGDHSLCKSCMVVRARAAVPDGPDIPADDAGKLRWLSGQLARAYSAQPDNALLARELRMTLQALMGGSGGKLPSDGDLEALFAELGSA